MFSFLRFNNGLLLSVSLCSDISEYIWIFPIQKQFIFHYSLTGLKQQSKYCSLLDSIGTHPPISPFLSDILTIFATLLLLLKYLSQCLDRLFASVSI